MAKPKPKSLFTGSRRIVSMLAWEDDYLDEEVEAFIEFDENGSGGFHFGNVQGHMDCRLTTRDGESRRSNGPGTGTPRWMPPKAEAGLC
jgi:hypothetical protein